MIASIKPVQSKGYIFVFISLLVGVLTSQLTFGDDLRPNFAATIQRPTNQPQKLSCAQLMKIIFQPQKLPNLRASSGSIRFIEDVSHEELPLDRDGKSRWAVETKEIGKFFPKKSGGARPLKENLMLVVSQLEGEDFDFTKLDKMSAAYRQIEFVAQFIMEQYQRRGWSAEFLSGLHQDYLKYAHRSKFYTVWAEPELVANSIELKPQIVGNIKMVSAIGDTELLPVEEKLGLHFKSNGGLKIEPSGFSALKEYNVAALSELHFIRVTAIARDLLKRPNHEPNKPVFYTYGDQTSIPMLTAFGFKKMSEKTYHFENSDWWALSATAEDLSNITEILARIRKNYPPEYIQYLEERLKQLQNSEW